MARTKVKEEKKETKKVKAEKVSKVAKVIKDTVDALKGKKKIPAKILQKIAEIDRLQAEEKKITDQKDALKNEVKAYMKENKLEEILTDDLKALYIVSYRTNFDEEGFKTKHPKMYKEYLNFKVKSDKPTEAVKVSSITKTQRKAK